MEEKTKKLARAGSVFRVYGKEVIGHPWLLTLILLSSLGLQAADLAAPLFLREFFNLLTVHAPDAATISQLIQVLGLTGAMWFLDWFFQRAVYFLTEHIEVRAMKNLFGSSFSYLLGHSHNFFVSHFAGSLTHRVSKYARSFETLFDTLIMNFLPTFFFVLGAIAVLFIRNHTLGIILAIWSLLFLCFQIYASHKRRPIRAARSESETLLTGALADAIGNQNTIMLFSGAQHEETRFGTAVEKWGAATLRSWRSDGWVQSGLGLLMIAIQIVLLYGAIRYWQEGLLTIGDFVLIQAYLLTTFNRLLGINFQLRRFYDALADAGEMLHILNLPHEIRNVSGAPALSVSAGEISFRDIDFYFNEKAPVLSHLELTVRGGEKIALVGPSGAGKSTITKLLLRLYDVASGSIQIDGQNIAKVTQESLREAISFVPQEPILFHRTLMENIRYGRQSATDEEVIEAAKLAHCHEFISEFPEAYRTFVGERGVRLSGGERQRVAIARAILKNAPILVLDEATSSLDSESEAFIQDALEVLMRGKTVLVIAHRLSTIMKMDRIIVIESGKVVAEGTHQKLLAEGGLYAKLWSIQAGGFLKDADDGDIPAEHAEEEIGEEVMAAK